MGEHVTSEDGIDLLMQDHRSVEGLFARFAGAESADEREAIARQVCLELKVHTLIEEEIFYPALRGRVDEDLLDEAIVEHDAAKVLIREIEVGFADQDFYAAKVHVLKEAIEHHVEEEEDEHDGLFVQARKADADLRALGDRMRTRKRELLEAAERGQAPPLETRSFDQAPPAREGEPPTAGPRGGGSDLELPPR